MVAHSGAPLFCFLAGLDSANRTDAKVTKAGLVGPAFLCGTGSFGLVSIADPAFSKSTAELVLAAYDAPGWGFLPNPRTQINSYAAQRGHRPAARITSPLPGSLVRAAGQAARIRPFRRGLPRRSPRSW